MQPSARPDFDQALKRLLLREHDGFLALVAPGLTWRGTVSPELPAVARQADLVWEVEGNDGRRGLLHIELQTKVEADIGERLADYAIRLWRRDRRPVRSLVIFLRPAETVPSPPFVIKWMGQESVRYTFDVVRLWEIPPERILETTFYQLWPLAGIMAGATADTTVAVAEQIAHAPVPQTERDELTRLLVLLAGVRIPVAALLEALRRRTMLDNLWEESSLKEALATRWREEAMGETVQVTLEGRFGPLSDDVVETLHPSDEATLRLVARHAATDTLEQVRARLGLT